MKRRFLIFVGFLLIHMSIRAQHWESVGGGVNYFVEDLYEHNGLLYVCGSFDSIAGGTIASLGLGIWNGNNWISGNTDFYGTPLCFIKFQGKLHIAGHFTKVDGNKYCNKIARQDSVGWASLSSGVTNGFGINCMAVYNNDLFVGGQFTIVDSTITANRIARWDGIAWHPMGTGFTGGITSVNDMAVFQNELYVGGFFGYIDGVYAPGICRWNGSNWNTLSTGTNGPVKSLYADSINNRLYVGGQFTVAGGVSCPTGVAYWDGNNWFPVGSNPYIPAYDIILYNGILYNASIENGAINSIGDTIDYLAWFDGVNWRPVLDGLSIPATDFFIYQGELYVGGGFKYAGDSLVNHIAKWIPGSLGIQQPTGENLVLRITPNPAKDEVILEFVQGKSTVLTLMVTDPGGKTVLTEQLSTNNKHIINTSGLVSGVYIFFVYQNKKLVAGEKVVISR